MKKVTFLLLAMLCTLIASAYDHLYLVGSHAGWDEPKSENSSTYDNWKLPQTSTDNVYEGTFSLSGEVYFRFYSALNGWDSNSLGSNDGNNTSITVGAEKSINSNNSQNCWLFKAGSTSKQYTFTVNLNTNKLTITEYTEPSSGGGEGGGSTSSTMTVYFDDSSSNFNPPYIYYWSDSHTMNWVDAPAMEVYDATHHIYKKEIPADASVIFRNSGGGSQTSDITGAQDGYVYKFVAKNDGNNNGSSCLLSNDINAYIADLGGGGSSGGGEGGGSSPSTMYLNVVGLFNNWTFSGNELVDGVATVTVSGVTADKNDWKIKIWNGTKDEYYSNGQTISIGEYTITGNTEANMHFANNLLGKTISVSWNHNTKKMTIAAEGVSQDDGLTYYSNQQAVFFEKPSNWGTGIKIYIYNGSTEYAGSWDTTSMTHLGNGIYSWTETREALPAGTKVIFSDGTNQVPASGQEGFDFVNGGYYTTSGYQRTISPQSGSAPAVGSTDMKPDVTPTGDLPVLYINTYDYELDAKGKAVKDKATGCYVKKLDDGGNPTQLFEVNSYDLPDKNYRYGEYWLVVPEGYTFAPGAASIGSAEAPLALEIKARGNYTREAYSKKPFKLKLDAKQNLLNMNINGSASKHWALLNGADDNNGYLRNYVGFMLGERIGLPWSPRQQPIEVVINGDYRGMYLLTESIRVGDGRVPITELEDEVTDLSLLSGGYLIEMDNYCDDPNTLNLGTYNYHPVYVTPDSPEVLSQEQKTFLTDQVNAMTSRMGQDALWSYMELDDAARYYIIMELLGHWEAYHGSTYMFRDYGIDQKWHFTPLWDCGHAFDTNTRQKYFTDYAKYGNLWIGTMRTNQKFKNKVAETWKWFMTNCYGDILTQIDAFATHVTSAAGRDHDRWSGVRRPTNCSSEAGAQDVENNSDMSSKASYVKSYLNDKVNWLKGRSEFGGYDSNNPSAYPEPTRDNTASAPLHPMYNPVTIKFTLPDVTVEAGQSADMAINYSSTDAHLTSIEADITVPEGLTLTFKSLSDLANGHTGSLTADATTEGLYHLAVTGSNTFTRANGTVAYLTVTAAADLEPATYAVSTSKVACTDKYSGSNTRIISAKKAKGNVIVTVTEPPVVVTLSSSLLNLAIGEEATLTATVTPEDLDDKTVTWSSDNEAVATVSADGKVTAVAKGNANITATCGEASATCVVSVGKIAQHIEWEQSFTDRVAMETSVQLTATASSGLAVTYTITNGNAFARISGSTLEAIAPGVVTVMASQMGNENYSPAESVSKTIVIWEGYTTGDLTGNGTIELSDMIPVLDFLVGRYDDSEKPFNEKAADINGDGSVNIVDITLLIDMIMEQEQQDSTPSQIRRRISKAGTSERAIITSNAPDEINITFTNINRFVAVHFDLVLPEDITVVQAECSVAGSNHNISFKDKDTYARFLLWGIGNPVFADDGYIHVKLSGDVDGDVTVNNITLNTGAPTYADDPGQNCTVKLPMATGIADIEADATEGVYYNLQGVRVLNPEHGIYIHVVDGKASRVAL